MSTRHWEAMGAIIDEKFLTLLDRNARPGVLIGNYNNNARQVLK